MPANRDQVNVRPGKLFRVFTMTLDTNWDQAATLRDCIEVMVVSPIGNTEDVFVSYDEDTSSADRSIFNPGRGISLPISNTNLIWARAETAAATLEIWAILE